MCHTLVECARDPAVRISAEFGDRENIVNSLVQSSVQIAAQRRLGRELWANFARAILALGVLTAATVGYAEENLAGEPDESIEEILIKGQDPGAPELFVVTPNRATPNAPDSAEMMQLIPGGGVVNNGRHLDRRRHFQTGERRHDLVDMI